MLLQPNHPQLMNNHNLRIQQNPLQIVNNQNVMMQPHNHLMMSPNGHARVTHSPNSHNNASRVMINYKDPIVIQKNPN